MPRKTEKSSSIILEADLRQAIAERIITIHRSTSAKAACTRKNDANWVIIKVRPALVEADTRRWARDASFKDLVGRSLLHPNSMYQRPTASMLRCLISTLSEFIESGNKLTSLRRIGQHVDEASGGMCKSRTLTSIYDFRSQGRVFEQKKLRASDYLS